MADASLLSVLAGTDPLSPQILEALHAEQARGMVSDPANWQNQGIAGGLARALAGALAPNAAPQVAQIAGQRTAAQPDMAKLLASADPFATLAANPDQYSPLARAMVLNGASPASVSEARLRAAQAGLANTEAQLKGLDVSGIQGVRAAANAGAPVTPLGGKGAPAVTGGFPSDYTGRPQAGAAADIDLAQLAKLPPDQQQQAVARMPAAQRLKLKQQMMALRNRQATSAPAAGPALGAPPT